MSVTPHLQDTPLSSSLDRGLQRYMLSIYNYMAIALTITAITSYAISRNIALASFFWGNTTAVFTFGLILPILLCFFFSRAVAKMSFNTAVIAFFSYAVVIGCAISYIFIIYPMTQITQAFLVTAITFLSVSIYGYITKKSLASIGSFLAMGLWGIVLAHIVNMFLTNSSFALVISAITVVIFTVLTAFETQKAKALYSPDNPAQTNGRAALISAFGLYLSFLNLFLNILRIMGILSSHND